MHEQSPNASRWEKWSHWLENVFWYHYKWYFFVGIFAAVLLISSVIGFVTQVKWDWTVPYVHLGAADKASAAAVKKPNAYLQRKEAERAERLKASRVKKIEARLSAIEQEKEALETALALPETAADYEKVLFLTGQLTALGDERDALEEEWLTLSE